MSISDGQYSGASDSSIVSPIRRSPIRYYSDSSHSSSLLSLPPPVVNAGSSISPPENSSNRRSPELIKQFAGSSNISLKTARSHFSMTSKFSNIFPDEYFYNTDSSESARTSGTSESNSLNMNMTQRGSLSGESSGVTIYSNAPEERTTTQTGEKADTSSYICDSINLSRDSRPPGLVNTGPVSSSNMASSQIFHGSAIETSPVSPKKAVTAPIVKTPDRNSSQNRGIGTMRIGNDADDGLGALAVSSSSFISPSRPSRRKLALKSDDEVSPNRNITKSSSLKPDSTPDNNVKEIDKQREKMKMSLRKPKNTAMPQGAHLTMGERRESILNPIEANNGKSLSTYNHFGDKLQHKEYPRWSLIRKAGPKLAQLGCAKSIRSGLPMLPNFPEFKKSDNIGIPAGESNTSIRSIKVDLETRRLNRYDQWGRKEASFTKTILSLIMGLFFPPLWLFLGAGYFDMTLGTIPKWAKFSALLLTLITLAAGTALVIVFSLVEV